MLLATTTLSSNMATIKSEPCYVSIDLTLDLGPDGDENAEENYSGNSVFDAERSNGGNADSVDDNVEIIHLNSSNLNDTLSGLDIFSNLSNSDGGPGIGLSAGLFCPVTVQWLLENFETKDGVSLPRSTVYNHYISHCRHHEMEPVNAASFGKLIRSIFLGLQTRRLGTRGNSKYHYYGIQIKPDSSLNDINDFGAMESQTESEYDETRVYKKPAETVTSGTYNLLKLKGSPQPCCSSQVKITQEVVREGVDVENPEKDKMEENTGTGVVELMSMMNVQAPVAEKKECCLKFCSRLPPINFRSKNMKDWKKDIQLITAITCDTRRNNDLAKKVTRTAGKVMNSCPKIDYRLASDILSRSEVDQFRQSYQKLAHTLVESCLMYKLDIFLLENYNFWNGSDAVGATNTFTRAKLIAISQNECIRQYVLNVDSQIYDTIIRGLLPDNLDPLPVIVLDVLHNFVEKFLQTVSFSMEGFPNEMRSDKMSAATAFSSVIQSHCRLNILADMVRPLFEELNRKKIHDALMDLNVPAILSVSIYPLANDDKYFYQIEHFRHSLQTILDLDSAARWIEAELEKALKPSKSNKEDKSYDHLARTFALDMSYLMHVILNQIAFTDPEINGFLTLFASFTDSYVLHVLERRRILSKNSSLLQYFIHFLA